MFKYVDGDFQQGTTTEDSVGKLYILDGGRSENKLEITKESLKDIEQLTEENRQKWLAKAGWGLAGALAFGPIGVAAGLFLGGKGKKYSVVCTLSDDRSFMAEVSDDIYKKLVAMKRFGKNLTTTVQQAITTDAEIEQPITPSPELLPENCPRCNSKLPPPFQSSGRIVCSKCGWSNKPKKS
jgi:hypothetical protein